MSTAISIWRTDPITAKETAIACARAALAKKAEDLVILDLRGLSTLTDFFVVCSASSQPQLKAIRNEVEDQLRIQHHQQPFATDGHPGSAWLIVDYSDVLVHIFSEELRTLYALEDLWGDAPRVEIELPEDGVSAPNEA